VSKVIVIVVESPSAGAGRGRGRGRGADEKRESMGALGMGYTYEELHKKTVAQLRDIAKGLDHESVRGYTTMHKHELLPALCQILHIDMHDHHAVIGIDKAKLRSQIRELKAKRDAALEARDMVELRETRHKIKRLKRKIRRATV
jgi:hypothetical protein